MADGRSGKSPTKALTESPSRRRNGGRDAGIRHSSGKPLSREASYRSAGCCRKLRRKLCRMDVDPLLRMPAPVQFEATRCIAGRAWCGAELGWSPASALALRSCRFPAGRLAPLEVPAGLTGAAPPGAQSSPGRCMTRGPMSAQKAHLAVPLGSRPSTPSGDCCCFWGPENEGVIPVIPRFAVISVVRRRLWSFNMAQREGNRSRQA